MRSVGFAQITVSGNPRDTLLTKTLKISSKRVIFRHDSLNILSYVYFL